MLTRLQASRATVPSPPQLNVTVPKANGHEHSKHTLQAMPYVIDPKDPRDAMLEDEQCLEVNCENLFPGPLYRTETDDEVYRVERILGERINARGEREYCIKWFGWPLVEASWEPEASLLQCEEAIKHFQRRKLGLYYLSVERTCYNPMPLYLNVVDATAHEID
jgi:hypothetical protein